MSQMNCDRLIDYFNGHLDNDTEKQFEEHLAQCPECREELNELQELTGRLPFAAEPVEPPEGMKKRVLSHLFAEETPSAEQTETKKSVDESKKTNRFRKNKWTIPLLAAILTVSLLGYGLNFYNQSKPETATSEEDEELHIAQLSVELNASEGMNATGRATMVGESGERKMIVQVTNLQALQGEEVYQVWLLEGGQPFRAGSLIPDKEGFGAVSCVMNPDERRDFDTIAITKEPTTKSPTPQGKIILSSSL